MMYCVQVHGADIHVYPTGTMGNEFKNRAVGLLYLA